MAIVNFAIVASAALITASLALVVEDLLPGQGDDRQFVAVRWLVFTAALLVLLVFVMARSAMREAKGTLFYVQVLDEGMANVHEPALRAASHKRMETWSLTRWVDLSSCGVIDLVEVSEAVGRDLEDAINSDREDTGYALASNFLWSMGLSVGATLPQGKGITLVEFVPERDQQASEKGSSAANPITRRLRREPKANAKSVPAEISFPLSAEGTGKIRCEEKQVSNPTGDRVGVWLALGNAAAHFSVDGFEQFGVSSVQEVTYDGIRPDLDGPDLKFTGEQMRPMGPEIAEILRRIKTEHPQQELVVVAMMPKAVALSTGWHLAQQETPFFRDTYLMHFDTVYRKQYVPVRVRSSQPNGGPSRTREAVRQPDPGGPVVNGEV